MSKFSSWFHDFVNGLGIDQSAKDFLNKYGLYIVWGLGILFVLFFFGRMVGC